MFLGNLIAHAAGTRVQEHPHGIGFIQTQLNEVVAAAQRPQLLPPLRRMRQVNIGFLRQFRQLPASIVGGTRQDPVLVIVARRQRNGGLDGVPQLGKILTRQIGGCELGAHGNHAASDVHAHGGGNHGINGAEHGSHRRP